MSVIDRLGQVVKSEWNSRFSRDKDDAEAEAMAEVDEALKKTASTTSASTTSTTSASTPTPALAKPPRTPQVNDVQSALRVLELQGSPTLDEVRARYRQLARRYHPKTQAQRADDRAAAHVVLETLTDALEVLEQHLLPLPP